MKTNYMKFKIPHKSNKNRINTNKKFFRKTTQDTACRLAYQQHILAYFTTNKIQK